MAQYLINLFRAHEQGAIEFVIPYYHELFKRLFQVDDISEIEKKTFSETYVKASKKHVRKIKRDKQFHVRFSVDPRNDVISLYVWDSDMFTAYTNFGKIRYDTVQAHGALFNIYNRHFLKLVHETQTRHIDLEQLKSLLASIKSEVKARIREFISSYPDMVKAAVEKLKQAIETSPALDNEIVAFRGIYYRKDIPESRKYIEYLKSLNVGDKVGMEGFASFSPTPVYSLKYFTAPTCCLMCVTIPKGTKMLYIPDDVEIVLWRPVLTITGKRTLNLDIDIPGRENEFTLQVIDAKITS